MGAAVPGTASVDYDVDSKSVTTTAYRLVPSSAYTSMNTF